MLSNFLTIRVPGIPCKRRSLPFHAAREFGDTRRNASVAVTTGEVGLICRFGPAWIGCIHKLVTQQAHEL